MEISAALDFATPVEYRTDKHERPVPRNIDMNLIILTTHDSLGGDFYRLAFHRAEHVRSVLKAEVGDELQVGLLNGPIGPARIERISDNDIVLRTGELHQPTAPMPTVDLICALPRPQTLKKVLTTVATMGVRRLYLVRANRVEKSYFHSPLLEPDKYTPFLIEGLSQGRLTRLPEVTIHDRFKVFFEETLAAIESAEPQPAVRLLPDIDSTIHLKMLYRGEAPRLLGAIGPEGGWVPFETDLMQQMGFRRFALGRWTLRVETAVTALLAQIELVRAIG